MPTEQNITRVRGDTYPIVWTLTDASGAAVDITGCTFLLTVDPSSSPVDASNNVLQLSGVITNAAGGGFEFRPTDEDMDLPTNTSYYYDIQMTDASGYIRTLAFGRFVLTQDLTKD